MSANSNDLALFTQPKEEMWEIKTQDKTIVVNSRQWEEIQRGIEKQVKLIMLGDVSFNPAYIKSVTKVLKEEERKLNLPEWVKEQRTPQDIEKFEKLKAELKKKLKERNDEWSSPTRVKLDEEKLKQKEISLGQALHSWESLTSNINFFKFPHPEDRNWKKSFDITTHRKDKEDHKVEYLICPIALPNEYRDYEHRFFIEAGDIWCPLCKAHIKKTISIYNQIEGLCLVKEY
jgi:hypothetical protein